VFTDHDEAFLQTVCANPADDAPRLIYADYLEETGDPVRVARAEFIRLQCQLEALADHEPHRQAMQQREAVLLAAYLRKWNGPVHRRLQAGPLRNQVHARRTLLQGWCYRRGFIGEIRAQAVAVVHHAPVLAGIGPLETFRLWGIAGHGPALAQSSLLLQAQTIDLLDPELPDADLLSLAASPLRNKLGRRGQPLVGAPRPDEPLQRARPGSLLAQLRAWWRGER